MADDPAPAQDPAHPKRQSHHLGLPLPSGQVAAFYEHDGVPLLVNEAPLRDIALDEEVEIERRRGPDLQTSTTERRRALAGRLGEGGATHSRSRQFARAQMDAVHAVEITNARIHPPCVELRLTGLRDGTQLVRADKPPFMHNGFQTFRLTVPAEGSATFRYQTANTRYSPEPDLGRGRLWFIPARSLPPGSERGVRTCATRSGGVRAHAPRGVVRA